MQKIVGHLVALNGLVHSDLADAGADRHVGSDPELVGRPYEVRSLRSLALNAEKDGRGRITLIRASERTRTAEQHRVGEESLHEARRFI